MGENPIPETLNSTVRSTRDYALDLLRILSCLGIVILYESGYMSLTSIGWSTYQALVRPCLWVFALISGYFILGRPIKDMKSFYLKKVSTIVIPLIVYSLIYQLWNGRHSFDSIISFFGVFSFKAILTDTVAGHLWFFYTLIGIYLIAPFLQKLFKGLSDSQFIGLLCLVYLFTAGPDYLAFVGIKIDIAFPLSGVLLFYFILGYALSRFDIKRFSIPIIILGIINIPLTAFMLYKSILSTNLATSSINMLVGTLFYYVLVRQLPTIKANKLQRCITSVSKRTYSIYLIHLLVLSQLAAWGLFPITPANHLYMPLIASVCIFILSYIASQIIDYLTVKPLSKLWNWIFFNNKPKLESNLPGKVS